MQSSHYIVPSRELDTAETRSARELELHAARQNENNAAFPSDTSPALIALMKEYEQKKTPLPVSFRQLVPWLKMGERATHYLHPYPAKLLPQIAHFFLAAGTLSRKGDTVLDPFGGSGTVALETVLSGRNALYAEVNPLARLITRTKTTAPSPEALRQAYSLMRDRSVKHLTDDIPDVVNSELWYAEEIFRCLTHIKGAIQLEQNPTCRDALLIAFSVVARKVSRADPRFSVPVRRKVATSSELDSPGQKEASEKVWKIFDWQISANIKRYKELEHLLTGIPRTRYVGPDSRALRLFEEGECGTPGHSAHMPDSFVDLIITSPPYVSAQKYVRATSLSLGWLGLTPSKGLSELEQRTIGREHIRKSAAGIERITFADPNAVNFVREVAAVNPARAAITLTYLSEMNDAVAEMARVLRPGGYAVIVIGDNLICGRKFETTHYIKQMFEAQSCELRLHLTDRIPSRGLMTKRNGTAAVIAEESILVFHKR